MNLDRSHYVEDINAGMKDQEVILGGWVEDLRKMGKMTFLTLRDVTGIIQIILTDDVMKSIDNILNAIMEIKKCPGIVFMKLFIMAQKVQQSTLGYGKRKCTLVDFI